MNPSRHAMYVIRYAMALQNLSYLPLGFSEKLLLQILKDPCSILKNIQKNTIRNIRKIRSKNL